MARRISELALFAQPRAAYPTCVQQINYPFHKGAQNPMHGKFHFVGSIPGACYDHEKSASNTYDTEDAAIRAAVAAGAERIQGVDCRFINVAEYR